MNRNDYLFHPPRFADPSVLRPLTAPLAFARTVERFPNRLAVVDGPTRLTWAELAERVRAFAAALPPAVWAVRAGRRPPPSAMRPLPGGSPTHLRPIRLLQPILSNLIYFIF